MRPFPLKKSTNPQAAGLVGTDLGVPEARPEPRRSGALRQEGGFGQSGYSSCRCWVKRQISPQGLR